MNLVLNWLSFLYLVSMIYAESQPRVVTPKGTYVGKKHKSARNKRDVLAFTGIPYAKAPIDDLRFKVKIV